MSVRFDEHITGRAADGRPLAAAVCNDNQVRAAAGLTMAAGAVAFAYAYFDKFYVPLQVVATFFFVEFALRLTVGLRFSPTGVVAGVLTRPYPPEWVSAKPKRFAWTLGLALSGAMTVITNSGIRGTLPRTICLLCLTLMWLESVLGLCVGCEIHAGLVRRGWASKDTEYEACAHGVCEAPRTRARA
jgi:hypothetical protein